MEYLIKKIDSKEFEYNLVNCDTCRIFLNGFQIGKYNFNNNTYYSDVDDWCVIDYFERLTARQKGLILINANKYFIKLYKKIYYDKLKDGHFFAPTDENLEKQLYYITKIQKCKNNILAIEKNIYNKI